MDKETYITMHQAADRMALEAARTADKNEEADCYTENYTKVIEHLISEYEKRRNPTDS